MSRKGNCWDNAPSESFFKTLKSRMGNKQNYKNIMRRKNLSLIILKDGTTLKGSIVPMSIFLLYKKHYFFDPNCSLSTECPVS